MTSPGRFGRSPSQRPGQPAFGCSPPNTSGGLAVPRANDGELGASTGGQYVPQELATVKPEGISPTPIRQVGGLNSIDSFARSWQRAASFLEITPRRPSFVYSSDGTGGESDDDLPLTDDERHFQRKSLLRQALEHQAAEGAVFDYEEEAGVEAHDHDNPVVEEHRVKRRPIAQREGDVLSIEPILASPFGGSYGTSYGTLGSRLGEHSMRHAGRLWREQNLTGAQEPDKEREPLLVKRVELEDGKVVNVVVGQSTVPQTVFNSVNVLIGVGLLSLPLGVRYAGWLIGMAFLLFATIVTHYTARVLVKCLDVDGTLITFADLAYISFGHKARIVTSILFTLELIAANVALVVLFADSWNALVPGVGLIQWKIICGVLLMPLSMLPLRVLSFTSILGIVCCFGIVSITLIDGLSKPHAPGSLREVMPTYLFPEHWATLPLSFGLLMSPWGGHSVFPNIYRDMRQPRKYHKSLKVTYVFTCLLDLSMAVAGLLMFGENVKDEITSNIIATTAYPKALSICIVCFIAIIPMTKIPLKQAPQSYSSFRQGVSNKRKISARPIVSTIEILSGLDPRAVSGTQGLIGMSGLTRGILKVSIRLLVNIVFIAIAIVFPSFDRIMALLGSALCFAICVILPLCFYLKIFGNEIPLKERILDYMLIVVCSVMAVVGTVWVFLPKESIGAV
ncbi:hypothetical protein GP486_000197 [Trichoglossum hirsutum]|uniref:Amino acid transporter transmembrane domain-containing protein n=1 Tax=Trichoglossum hirsutum TaxID=265104 RepID=A0A9P8LJ53_9PEZI|nr:hypothetical protein GP486_000197 [Trichoglossum hirsutum]